MVAPVVVGPLSSAFLPVSGGGLLFPPPSRVFLYSSSVRRIVCDPSGKDGNPCPSSSSGTSSTVGCRVGPCSQFFLLSVARYRRKRPSVSASSTFVAGVATPLTITWLCSKLRCTRLARINYHVVAIEVGNVHVHGVVYPWCCCGRVSSYTCRLNSYFIILT
jgi:hypothetical protein